MQTDTRLQTLINMKIDITKTTDRLWDSMSESTKLRALECIKKIDDTIFLHSRMTQQMVANSSNESYENSATPLGFRHNFRIKKPTVKETRSTSSLKTRTSKLKAISKLHDKKNK